MVDCHVATLLAKTFGWWIATSLRFSQRRLDGGLPRRVASRKDGCVVDCHVALLLAKTVVWWITTSLRFSQWRW
jgi:uncharacterized membrane protein YjgN (DUF898 family)